MTAKTKGIISIIFSAFGFALMAACVRLCDDYGPMISCFEKSFFRNFVALLIASFAFFRSAASIHNSSSSILHPSFLTSSTFYLLFLRCTLGTIGIFSNFYALSHIPIADGQTLNKTAPFFTVVFAWIFLKERVSMGRLLAITLAFLGAILVMNPGFSFLQPSTSNLLPYSLGLLGGICAGAAYAALRALGRHEVLAAFIVFVFSAFSCIVSIPLAIPSFVMPTATQIAILFGAGFGAAIGQFGITLAYRFAAPREIALFDYTNIIFTAAFGYLLFGQLSDPISILGMVVIIIAAFCLNSRMRNNS